MVELTEILGQLYEKLVVFISGLDAGTLQVTGIFGLALAWLGYLQFRGGPSTGPEQPARPAPSAPRPAGHQAQRQVAESAAPVAAAPKPVPREPERAYSTPLAKAVDTTLAGVKRVSISVPGVLLNESQVHECATLVDGIKAALPELCHKRDVYLIAQVGDDVGQAVAEGVLDAAGLLGPGMDQVPQHRLLFCSSLDGKVSIVRQIEPDLHIDGHSATVEDLQRFIPQLWLVGQAGAGSSMSSYPNVAQEKSLQAFFPS
eukprot:gene31117-6250_t